MSEYFHFSQVIELQVRESLLKIQIELSGQFLRLNVIGKKENEENCNHLM